MKKRKEIQFIESNGKPEWAVIPYSEYVKLAELKEISITIRAFKKDLAAGKEELIPSKFADRLINGENPIRVWREYRKLTQADLAEKVGISKPYLSQLENDERTASTGVLKKLANALMH